jgi:hypothetical protein
MFGRLKRWWYLNMLDRCPADLSRKCHWELVPRTEKNEGLYVCDCESMSYCHHYPVQCRICDTYATQGFSVPEVR